MKQSNYAGFWLRFLAGLLNATIILVPYFWLLSLALHETTIPQFVRTIVIAFLFAFSPIGFIYHILPVQLFGGTVGQLLTGLRITDEQGNRLTFKRVLFRETVGAMFAALLFGAGYFAIIKDPKKQGWNDKAVGSLVTVKQTLWPVALLLLVLAMYANISLIVNGVKAFTAGPLLREIQSLSSTLACSKESKNYPDSCFSKEFSGALAKEYTNIQNGNYTAVVASNELLTTAKNDTEKAFAHYVIGEAYLNMYFTRPTETTSLTKADEHLTTAYQLAPDVWQTNEAMVYLNNAKKIDPAESVKYARKIVELQPKNAYAYYLLSNVLFNAENKEEALAEAKKAVALAPKEAKYINLVKEIEASLTNTKSPSSSVPTAPKTPYAFQTGEKDILLIRSQQNGYSVLATLTDLQGNPVTDQNAFSYDWSTDSPSVVSVYPWSMCASGCPKNRAAINTVGEKGVGYVTVKAVKDGVLAAQATYTVTVQ